MLELYLRIRVLCLVKFREAAGTTEVVSFLVRLNPQGNLPHCEQRKREIGHYAYRRTSDYLNDFQIYERADHILEFQLSL